ncbi:MAG: imidazole glycerol phosphate synthase subunit hisF [Labilithrix sp.]|nr:imidazole glycerol phosphate synthase subunit hisF [Labilithrix sp.]
MLLPRVIPCLLVQDGGLVKTVKFKAGKYVGDPINTIKIFNDKRVDELILLDISASRERREPDYALIEEIASECFMPVCYGGGVRTVAQAKRIVGLGVEKIAVSSTLIGRPELLRELAGQLGSQSVVACIDVKKTWTGRYRVYDCSRDALTSLDVLEHADVLVRMGAGEILVNNVDRDGTQMGYDNELIRQLTARLRLPVIACGGAWTTEHLRSVVKDAGASAAAAGSMFVFQGPHRAVLISYPAYPEIVRLLGT